MSTFAEQVREARTRQELSQEALAIATGLSRKTVQNVEAGKAFSTETALALRSVLQIERADPKGDLLDAYLGSIPPADDPDRIERMDRLYLRSAAMLVATLSIGIVTALLVAIEIVPLPVAYVPVPLFVIATILTVETERRNRALRTERDVDSDRALARERFLRDPELREIFRASRTAES